MSIYGDLNMFFLNEYNIIKSKDNIEFNINKLGKETNILFITGFPGSGKTTLLNELYSKYKDKIITISADMFYFLIMFREKEKYSLKNPEIRKRAGEFICKYMDIKLNSIEYISKFSDNRLDKYFEKFLDWLFVEINSKKYKNKIIILEGVQVFLVDYSYIKDKPLIITGTSMVTSYIRKAKRDVDSIKKLDRLWTIIPQYIKYNKRIDGLIYSIEESVDKSEIDKNFKKKIGLKFDLIDISDKKVKSIVPNKFYDWIEDIKEKKNGIIAVESKSNIFAGFIFVSKNHSVRKVIAPFKVYEKYRGYGLGEILLKEAINKFDGNELGIYSDNKIAIKLYEKYGFKKVDTKTYKDGDKVIIMRRGE